MWLLIFALLLLALASKRVLDSPSFPHAQWKFCPKCGTELRTCNVGGKQRLACECGFVHWNNPVPVSVILIPHKDGGFVFVKRKFNPAKGRFALPAGFVDAGESPQEAAVREAKEETGLLVKIVRLLDVVTLPGPNHLLHFYLAEPVSGLPQAGDDAEDALVSSLENLPGELAFDSHKQVIESYFKGA